MKQSIHPIVAAYYNEPYRSNLELLVIPSWSANELWGAKESPVNFRNCLVGTAEECAATWQGWLRGNVFTVETEPSYYILRQSYSYRNQSYERWAIFASVSAIDGSIKIHENVSQEGAENTRVRFELSQADLTPIFVGIEEKYIENLHAVLQQNLGLHPPLLQYQENSNGLHTIWKISEKSKQKELENFFTNKNFFLLDGHHRFRGAQDNYKMGLGDGRLMACICTMHAKDLLILPIHRNIVYEPWLYPKRASEDLQELGCKISKQISWNQQNLQEIITQMKPEDNFFYFLPVQSAELIQVELPKNMQSENQEIPTIVERVESLFSKLNEVSLLPVQDMQLLMEQLAAGQVQASIFLPPISASKVREIANEGKILPRKSTQFHPKPALGLLCRTWIS